jgi:hypothetical protein
MKGAREGFRKHVFSFRFAIRIVVQSARCSYLVFRASLTVFIAS